MQGRMRLDKILTVNPKEQNGKPKPCFRNINFERALILRPRFSEAISMLCYDSLTDSTLDGDWLDFSHVKNAIQETIWTAHLLHM